MKKLLSSRFKPAELVRIIYDAKPEAGTAFEDVLKPEYWAHLGETVRPGDRIEVTPEDGAYFAELLVRDCGRLWAKVELLRKVDFVAVDPAVETSTIDPSHTVEWRGPNGKFAVLRHGRAGGKEVLHSGFETREAANAWLGEHLKALAA
jgi:hypothetical protein